ncbi:hypothetical protein DUI87_06571 [Hirundo rustica rustica]|uniref:Uncharacterized protein n=1 Tax=Hirundo rustica rustica TaxID=333673 RepID=A0A3M0KTX3_HIRRU|nr:hypothetical protein DUI87_06571 [Hirundo rustica rustica]
MESPKRGEQQAQLDVTCVSLWPKERRKGRSAGIQGVLYGLACQGAKDTGIQQVSAQTDLPGEGANITDRVIVLPAVQCHPKFRYSLDTEAPECLTTAASPGCVHQFAIAAKSLGMPTSVRKKAEQPVLIREVLSPQIIFVAPGLTATGPCPSYVGYTKPQCSVPDFDTIGAKGAEYCQPKVFKPNFAVFHFWELDSESFTAAQNYCISTLQSLGSAPIPSS